MLAKKKFKCMSEEYTGYTQCATPKISKKVLHIGDNVAQRDKCPEKIEMKGSTRKNKGQSNFSKNVAHRGHWVQPVYVGSNMKLNGPYKMSI